MAEPCGGYIYKGKQYTKEELIKFLNTPKGRDYAIKDSETVLKQQEDISELKGQMKDLFDASLEAVKMVKDDAVRAKNKKQFIVDGIKKMFAKSSGEEQKKGSVKSSKSAILLDKLNKLDVNNQEAISSFLDYSEKLFFKADYDLKLSEAKKTRKYISGKKTIGKMKVLLSDFLKLKPENIDDIELYNEQAEKIKQAVSSSRFTSEGLKKRIPVNIDEMSLYIKGELEKQNKILEDRKREVFESKFSDFEGAKDLSIEQINEMLSSEKESDNPIEKEKEKRAVVQKAFDSISKDVKNILNDKEEVISKDSRRIINEAIDIDLNFISIKEGVKLIDSLSDFIVNKNTTGLDSVIAHYEGSKGVYDAARSGDLKSRNIYTYFTKVAGEAVSEQIGNLKLITEKLFGGGSKSDLANRIIGISDFENGAATAIKKANDVSDEYGNKFLKTKPNNKPFNDRKNVIEREMFASIYRDIIGSESKSKAEFKRNKEWVEHSIEVLSNGNSRQKSMAKDIQYVYDKILKDSENRDDVVSKVDKINVEAVDTWIKNFNDILTQLEDVSENIHGNTLERDKNYTPVTIKKMSGRSKKETAEWYEQSFTANTGVPKNKAGVLEKTTRAKAFGDMYKDYNFESNMVNAFKSALMDIHTSRAVRKIDGAIKSDGFKNLIPDESLRKLYSDRIEKYVSDKKGFHDWDGSKLNKAVGTLETLLNTAGTARALVSLSGPIKQAIPLINTFINTGTFPLRKGFNSDYLNFVANSGRAVSTRGKESYSLLKESHDITNVKKDVLASRLLDFIAKKDRFLLKMSIGKSDIFTAVASWGAYYEQSLKRQGLEYKNIDYSNHKLNQKAADYADNRVDKNQNVSDSSQEGLFYKSQNPTTRLVKSGLFPFSKFNYNQKFKMGTDISVIRDKNQSNQDRIDAARSLSATLVEETSFKALTGLMSYGWYCAAMSLFGKKETEEEKNDPLLSKVKDLQREAQLKKIYQQQASGIVSDIISPLPAMDGYSVELVDSALDKIQEVFKVAEQDKAHLYVPEDKKLIDAIGILGIQMKTLYDTNLIYTAVRTGKYTDKYGNETMISDENRRVIAKYILPVSLLHSLGFLPAEAKSFADKAMKEIKNNQEFSEEDFDRMFEELDELEKEMKE